MLTLLRAASSITRIVGKDQRGAPRLPIELRVDYKKMNTFFADYTKNISKGGTFIKTSKPLKIGTEFVFKLVIPQLREPVELKGKVMWTKKEGEDHIHPEEPEAGMGIRFVYDAPNQRGDFESLVERMMKESLGDHLYERLMATAREEE